MCWVGKGLICFNFRLNYFWNHVSARFVVSALVLLILVTFLLDELDKKVTLQDKVEWNEAGIPLCYAETSNSLKCVVLKKQESITQGTKRNE